MGPGLSAIREGSWLGSNQQNSVEGMLCDIWGWDINTHTISAWPNGILLCEVLSRHLHRPTLLKPPSWGPSQLTWKDHMDRSHRVTRGHWTRKRCLASCPSPVNSRDQPLSDGNSMRPRAGQLSCAWSLSHRNGDIHATHCGYFNPRRFSVLLFSHSEAESLSIHQNTVSNIFFIWSLNRQSHKFSPTYCSTPHFGMNWFVMELRGVLHLGLLITPVGRLRCVNHQVGGSLTFYLPFWLVLSCMFLSMDKSVTPNLRPFSSEEKQQDPDQHPFLSSSL